MIACDSGEYVKVENKSGKIVVVWEDVTPIEIMQPGVSQNFTILGFEGELTYKVKTFESRTELASITFTWDQIRHDGGYTLVAQ